MKMRPRLCPCTHRIRVCECRKGWIDVLAPVHLPQRCCHTLTLHQPGPDEVIHQVILTGSEAGHNLGAGAHAALLLLLGLLLLLLLWL
jgi:hypothetical protein